MNMASSRRDNPWYVEAFLAIGGWISGLLAAVAIFAFIAAIFDDFKNGRAAFGLALVIGLGFVGAGIAFARSGAGDFRRHFSVSVMAAGLTATTIGCWYLVWSLIAGGDHTDPVAADSKQIGYSGLISAALFAPVAGVAARSVKDAILTFLSTSAWFWIVAISLTILNSETAGVRAAFEFFPAIAALFGVLFFAPPIGGRINGPMGAALLVAPLVYYQTLRGGVGVFGVENIEPGIPASIAFAIGVVYCLALSRTRFPLLPLLGATAVTIAGVWLLPEAGNIAILILLAGMAGGHRGLAAVGVVALAWFIVKFYDDLSMTLIQKSLILGALGAATLLGAFLSRQLGAAPKDQNDKPRRAAHRPLLATLLFGALLLASLGLVNRSVIKLETEFADAREILLPLGPVDPRSLIQGDYMVLNFREDIYPELAANDALPNSGEAFLKIDAENVASFSRIANPGDQPRADEIRIDYVMASDGMRYCPTSYFFQEGEAAIFAVARFAVVRVAADGKTRLIALADAERRRIVP